MASKSPNAIKKLRIDKNLTQNELAKILNISKSSITNYERGKRTPNAEIIAKMEKFFNVSANYILGNISVAQNKEACNSVSSDKDKTSELFYEISNLPSEKRNDLLFIIELLYNDFEYGIELKNILQDKTFFEIMKHYNKIDNIGKNKMLERSIELYKLYPLKKLSQHTL